MLIIPSKNRVAQKLSYFGLILFAITMSFGALLTMHFYVEPTPKKPKASS